MRLLDKLINFIFSLTMMVVSVVILLVTFGFASSEYVNGIINEYVWNTDYETIVLIVAFIIFLASLKTTIFLADFKKKKKMPIMVNTDNGNIQIAFETIENTAKAVAKSYDEVKDVNARMVNKGKGVMIYMSILVEQDSNISAITKGIQDKVKQKVLETTGVKVFNTSTGVKVFNTDIKVKNIVEKSKKVVEDKIEQPLYVKGNIEKAPETEEVHNQESISTQENNDSTQKEE